MSWSLKKSLPNLSGEFCFPAVINGLTDMLKDEDPNIRAIATIALAKSGKVSPNSTLYVYKVKYGHCTNLHCTSYHSLVACIRLT